MNTPNPDEYIFAVPSARKESHIVMIPVPWEVTTSYGHGTSHGPQAILEASSQVDLYDLDTDHTYIKGYFLEKEDPFFMKTNKALKPVASKIKRELEKTGRLTKKTEALLKQVNSGTSKMVERVKSRTEAILKENKIPAVVGGDHSTPLGAISALGEKYKGDFGVLHIDAHADLRLAYQGFEHSHASIMRNVCALKNAPKALVQVGIRDFCTEEYDFIKANSARVFTYFDAQLKSALFEGQNWRELCNKIISHLPQNVYISFDIDGLSPEFCPNTGTPVPGGLSFDQAAYLLATLGRSGKRIIGFDLNEVAPGAKGDEWDGNVGARLLFKLCGWTAFTNKK